MSLKIQTKKSMIDFLEQIERLKSAMQKAEAVVIGAGAGLSTAAGFTYSGDRFYRYFYDFAETYGITDMYSGGFYPFETLEEYWAWWSRHIYYNRYVDAPKPVYQNLFELVKDKDYFVLTTNVDHCFQKAGFDKKSLFYTQGDYGLFQCSKPCCQKTYENETVVKEMLKQQKDMKVPFAFIPVCPVCGAPMTVNLRCDSTFVEDEGWHIAEKRYVQFIRHYEKKKIVYLELGVGSNTPGIIKYPFWQMTADNKQAVYICINKEETAYPKELESQTIAINSDIGDVLHRSI